MMLSNIFFAIKKVISALLLPPGSLVLVALAGLLLLKRSPRLARALLYTSTLLLLALSLPSVERGLLSLLRIPAFSESQATSAQAIIILSGDSLRGTPEYGDTVNRYTLERMRYGALLAKRYHLPILVSGGQVYGGGRTLGDMMAEALRSEFGVEVRWIEDRSRDTADNAKFSAELLKQTHITRVLLVTNDFHIPRSLVECAAVGLECIAAPITSDSSRSDSWLEELPNMGTLNQSVMVLHELLGLVAQRLRLN